MNKVLNWFTANNFKLTWFLIGFLVSNGLHNLAQGNYLGALVSLALAVLNYYINRR